jgi:hypothetical protein
VADHPGPLDPKVAETGRRIGKLIGDLMPPGMGFALLMFDLEGGGASRMNYISNAERKDMIAALHELLANFEGRSTGEKGHA